MTEIALFGSGRAATPGMLASRRTDWMLAVARSARDGEDDG